MQASKQQLDLTQGPIIKSLLIFSLPIMISNLFQQLYGVMDSVIVGNFLGDQALASVGATTAIFELIVGFALGIGAGLSIIVARYYGARNYQMVKRATAASLIIGLIISLMIMVIGHFGLKPLLKGLNTPAEIFDQAFDYIYIILIFILVSFAYNLGAGLLRSIGNSMVPLLILVFTSFLNVGLDIFMITVLQMGVKGAAYATVISQAISVVITFIYIYKKAPVLVPTKQQFKNQPQLYQELMSQGMAMGFMSSIVSIGSVILQTSVNSFGVAVIGAHVTARRILFFFTMPTGSISTALTTFVSQNFGARQFERIRQSLFQSNLMCIVYCLVGSIFMIFVTKNLMHLLTGSNDPVLLNTGFQYIMWALPFTPFLSVLMNYRNGLQGLGLKRDPLMSSVIEMIGKILFVIFLIPTLGYLGVMITEPILWTIMAIQLTIAYFVKAKPILTHPSKEE